MSCADSCGRCSVVPEPPRGAGSLYLWCPVRHVRTKIVQFLRDQGRGYTIADDGALVVALEPEETTEFAIPMRGLLAEVEAEDTRALFLANGAAPTMADVPRVESLRRFLLLRQSVWLTDILQSDRLTSAVMPIVRAGDRTQVVGHELLLRGRDAGGQPVAPSLLFDAARGAGLLFQLDLAARKAAIATAARTPGLGRLFINFTPTAIYDPNHCLLSTVDAIDDAGIPHENVVFEVIEADRTVDVYHLRGILNYYRLAGFKVALDDIGSGYSSLNLIHQLRPDYIKLDIDLVRGVARDPYKALIAQKLLEIARTLGIETIAEGIETEEDLAWVATHGATLAQGYLIGKPREP